MKTSEFLQELARHGVQKENVWIVASVGYALTLIDDLDKNLSERDVEKITSDAQMFGADPLDPALFGLEMAKLINDA